MPRDRTLTLKVFKSGNSAALRLPKELGFEPGEEVHATVEGGSLVLRHSDASGWPMGYFASWEALSAEVEPRPRESEGSRERRLGRLFSTRRRKG